MPNPRENSPFVTIRTSSLEKLISAIQYTVAPYMESDDYDSDHWSRELNGELASFLAVNGIELE